MFIAYINASRISKSQLRNLETCFQNKHTPIEKGLIIILHSNTNTVNSRFKKDLKLQMYLHKALFLDNRFLDSLHKYFLNQTILNLRKEKWTF